MSSFVYRPKTLTLVNHQQKSKIERFQIKIQNERYEKIIDIYKWRAQTQFPIVKVISVAEKTDHHPDGQLKTSNAQTNKTIEVKLQVHQAILTKFHREPFFKILYLLKESLIGLQRLFTKYGPFDFTQSMIFLNPDGKCRVWYHEDISSNSFQASSIKQTDFLHKVYKIFQAKTIQSKQNKQFFQRLKLCQQFFSALDQIQSYVQSKKINIPSHFKISQENIKNLNPEKYQNNYSNLTMPKRPDFLQNMAKSVKDQYFSPRKTLSRYELHKPNLKISNDRTNQTQNPLDLQATRTQIEHDKIGSIQKAKKVWGSKQEQKKSNLKFIRKFSSNYQNRQKKVNQRGLFQISKHQAFQQFSQSIIFRSSSPNSSQQNLETLLVKKKQIFDQNNWHLKVNSLFTSDDYKNSFVHKEKGNIKQKSPVKLDLLDQCQKNISVSFIGEI